MKYRIAASIATLLVLGWITFKISTAPASVPVCGSNEAKHAVGNLAKRSGFELRWKSSLKALPESSQDNQRCIGIVSAGSPEASPVMVRLWRDVDGKLAVTLDAVSDVTYAAMERSVDEAATPVIRKRAEPSVPRHNQS